MKHLHMLFAFLTIGAFCYSAFCILNKKQVGKAYMAVTHTLYTLLVVSGGYMLYLLTKVAGQQYWAYAKITLLIVAISAIIKARRTKIDGQAKAGVGVAFVALAGIVYLAFAKPMIGV